MKKYILFLLLQVSGTFLIAQTETWYAPFPSNSSSTSTYACENYYLALKDNQLLIHNKLANTNKTTSFSANSNLRIEESSDHLFVLSGFLNRWVWFSEDHGNTWDSLQLPNYVYQFYAKDRSSLLFDGDDTLYRSVDGGQSWTKRYVGRNFHARYAGFHVMHMYLDRFEVSHDFGATFKSINVGGNRYDGDINENGAIIHTSFGFGVGSKTQYTKDDGKNWTKISDSYLNTLYWISNDKAIAGYQNSTTPFLIDIPQQHVCQLAISGYGGIEFPYSEVRSINDKVYFSGTSILVTPISTLSCFDEKAKNNPNIKLEWAKFYQSSKKEYDYAIPYAYAASNEAVFLIPSGLRDNGLISEDKLDTLFNQNILVFDKDGKQTDLYHYKNGPYVYNPRIKPLGDRENYLHYTYFPRTMLSPDSMHLYSAKTGGEAFPFSILDKNMKYIKHFSFESNVALYKLDVKVLFIHENYFMLNLFCDSITQFIDPDGKMTAIQAGNKMVKVSNSGYLMQVFENNTWTGIALPNGEFLLGVTSNMALDTVKLMNQELVLQNPFGYKNSWIIYDSSGMVKEYYLLKNLSAELLFSSNQTNGIPGNVFFTHTFLHQTIISSKGDSIEFGQDGFYQTHYLRITEDYQLKVIEDVNQMINQRINTDSNFMLMFGNYRVKYGFNPIREFSYSAYQDAYLGLYSEDMNLIYNIGAVGSNTNVNSFYLDYPNVYFAALIEPDKNNIPGSSSHLNDFSAVVVGKFSIDTNPLGIDREKSITSPSAFPNPTHSITHLKTLFSEETPVVLEIYAIDGKLISSKSLTSHSDTIDMDMSGLTAGWYTIRLVAGERQESHLILRY